MSDTPDGTQTLRKCLELTLRDLRQAQEQLTIVQRRCTELREENLACKELEEAADAWARQQCYSCGKTYLTIDPYSDNDDRKEAHRLLLAALGWPWEGWDEDMDHAVTRQPGWPEDLEDE